MMMILPAFEFPQLGDGDEPLTLRPHFQSLRRPLATATQVRSIGLSIVHHATLTARLLVEDEQKPSRRHEDPGARGVSDGDEDSDSGGAEYGAAGGQHQAPCGSRRKKFVKLTDEDLSVDWYGVLGLEQSCSATDEVIRTAYRRRCLETHPDKQKDRSDAAFKQVQRAFEILGDPEMRLTYDSSRPFDDTIPGETLAEGSDFYAVFGPVFERNKKWSVEHNLPSIGTDATSIEEVNRFYDRWKRFQSWRDFSHMAELDEIDDGMCREEKRYYMRENERQLQHLRRMEQQRLRTLVERARKNDPRLRRKREAEEAQRLRDQQEREERRRQVREEGERRRAEEQERERKAQEEEQRKAMDVKNTIRQARENLLAFLEENGLLDETETNKLLRSAVRRPNIKWIFGKVTSAEEAMALVADVTSRSTEHRPAVAHPSGGEAAHNGNGNENFEVDAVLRFNEIIEEKERQVGVTRYGEAVKSQTVVDSTKSVLKVTAKHTKEWDEEDLIRLQKATAKYPPGTVERWSKITEQLRGKFTEEEALAKVNEITAGLHRSATASGASGQVSTASQKHSTGAEGAATAGSGSQTSSVEDWSVNQQKMLERGLRELKDYKEKDKFQKIAAMVEGKNARECFERFKYLCAMNKRK
uniref:Putative chaperone protein DNAj n=1 Tax=Trypanosoma congolense (strain IL3000) TaxID=1068625 RepID=G0UIZ5_TRYCI|nr:putative chaperone protein DNAj [Trypanosoma congolense IL3000]